jgi:hypothetical protein
VQKEKLLPHDKTTTFKLIVIFFNNLKKKERNQPANESKKTRN